MQEEWRPVVGYEEFYEVSESGCIRRIKSSQGGGVGELNPTLVKTGSGYLMVKLYDGTGRKGRRERYIHQIVADAFLGPCPIGLEINHIDGNSRNNFKDNLEYVSHRRNVDHAGELGLRPRGEKNGHAILTEDKVKTILSLKGKVPYRKIAPMYGVSYGCIACIMNGRNWKHLRSSDSSESSSGAA